MNNKNEFKPENGDIHKARGKKSINCKKGFKRLFTAGAAFMLICSGFSGCSSSGDARLFKDSALAEGEQTQYMQTEDMRYLPEQNGLKARDYTYMWQHGGILRRDKTLMVQTGYYGMSLDTQTGCITRLGPIERNISAAAAATEDDGVIMSLPEIKDMQYGIVLADGIRSNVSSVMPMYVNGEIVQFKDERASALRILDSGTFLQRADIMTMAYEDVANLRARAEFACNPESMQYTYQALSYIPREPAELYITMKLSEEYNRHEYLGDNTLVVYNGHYNGYIFSCAEGSGIKLEYADGIFKASCGNIPLNEENWEGFTFSVKPAVNITRQTIRQFLARSSLKINTQMLEPHTKENGGVFYDAATGAYTLETPDSSMFKNFYAPSTMNVYERMTVSLYNPEKVPVTVLLNFYKPYSHEANYADSGPAPCLRDAVTGEPIGLPVMISRNPHVYPVEPEPLYNATWANFYTYITVLPGQVLQFEYTNAYAKWGEVFAASCAHLCLIGWGGNQSWIVSSIGSFGEAFCYDPDYSHKCALGTDGHALLCLPNSYGTMKKYTWTPGPGGSDYFVYYDQDGQRQHLVNVKTKYNSYAPNIAQFTLNAYTLDQKAKAELTFTLGRTDDVNKVLQHFKYTVLEDINYTRLSFYQCGADNYNDSQFRTNYYGDYSGLKGKITLVSEDEEQPVGYFDDNLRNIKIEGAGFWLSQNNNGIFKEGKYEGISRGMVLREYSANINGREYNTPEISFYKTSLGTGVSLIGEISAPAEAEGILKAGSVIEGTVEYFHFPQIKESYYGPSELLKNMPEEYFDSWELLYEYALKGKLEISAQYGGVENCYPVVIKCGDANEGIGARFTLSGGMGYVPVTITGAPEYSAWRLYKLSDGQEISLEAEQGVKGNDYWQCIQDPDTGLFSYSFNLEHSGGEETYIFKKA